MDAVIQSGAARFAAQFSSVRVLMGLPLLLIVSPALAQQSPPPSPADNDRPSFENSQSATSYYAEEERKLWRENADALTALDAEFSAAMRALSEENSARLRALSAEQAIAYQDLSTQNLTGQARTAAYKRLQDEAQQKRVEQLAWYQAEGKRLNDEHKANREAQLAGTAQRVLQTQQQRTAAMARINGVAIGISSADDETDVDDVAESGALVPDGPNRSPGSRRPPSPLPPPPPDALRGGAGASPPDLPSITPGGPLDGQGPGGSDAVRDAQTESLGTARLTCNLSRGVAARWISPDSAGWIPPGGQPNASGAGLQNPWLMRFRARLEDPANAAGGSLPAGWCRLSGGSLGVVAGSGREVVVFAHAPAASFAQFRFDNQGVSVLRSNSALANPSSRFAVNVVQAVYGVDLRGGVRQTGSGEVRGTVRRIDDRWGDGGAIPLLVVNN